MRHYTQPPQEIPWDDETCKVVEKDQADEEGRIARWTRLLQTGAAVPARA